MSRFDTILVVDWSGGNDRGPHPKPDAIWAAVARPQMPVTPAYYRNRQQFETWFLDFLHTEEAAGRRVLASFDFPFGCPAGFVERVTGLPDPLSFWDWLEARIKDAPTANNRFDVAGQINRLFPGVGPFWGNGLRRDITALPRRGRARRDHGLSERRAVEDLAKGSFAVWQLSGAGAAGSQMLMGLPMLTRVRREFSGRVSVWPFEAPVRPIVLAEVYPSLLSDLVKARLRTDTALPRDPAGAPIKDAAQVCVLAEALLSLQHAGGLADALEQGAPHGGEGWILGVGAEPALRAAMSGPALSNDCFALPPGVSWTPVDEALDLLRSRLRPVVGIEQVAVDAAAGRFLASDHLARRSNPPAANSAVDGYGFAHSALKQGHNTLPLALGRAAAGAPYGQSLAPGYALRILTGAILPDGVDTVVLEEDVDLHDGQIRFAGSVRRGANTRDAGEDIAAGDLALAKHHALRPPDLGLLSAIGVATAHVFQRLRVGVLSTGDEVVDPGSAPDPSATFDANRPMLLAIVRRWGYRPVDLGRVGDDRDALRDCLDRAAGDVDVILTSGGASAGDEDHMSALLRSAGTLHAWRIAVKPGRPLMLGLWDRTPIFGLPGNPVAAFVCTLVFARPALAQLAGGHWRTPQGFDLPASFEKRKKAGRREYLRARVTDNGQVDVFASEGSGRITGLSWAGGLVEMEDGARHITPGDTVRYIPFESFGL